jgi:hypothetical protein
MVFIYSGTLVAVTKLLASSNSPTQRMSVSHLYIVALLRCEFRAVTTRLV